MKKFPYWIYLKVYALKAWVLRRFTPAGLFMLAVMGVAAMVGIDTTLAMVYQVFTLAAGMLLIGRVLNWRFRADLHVQRRMPRFVTCGQRFTYDVLAVNHGPKTQKDLHLIEAFADSRPSYTEFYQAPVGTWGRNGQWERIRGFGHMARLSDLKRGTGRVFESMPALRPNETRRIRLSMIPQRRGSIRLEGMEIARTDPLGLWWSYNYLSLPHSITVLPKRYHLPQIQLPGLRRYHSGGVALSSSVGDAEEFVSLRDYRPGDPLRRIHWKSLAKVGKPIVKEYQEEFFVRHVLILDTFDASDHRPAFEEAVSLAASFACTVQTQESLLDLLFVGLEVYCFTTGRGLGQTETILEALSAVRPCRTQQFDQMLPTVLERAQSWSGCICIFLNWDEPRKELVHLLRQFNLPVLALVVSDQDAVETLDPGPMGDMPENLHLLRAGDIDAGLANL